MITLSPVELVLRVAVSREGAGEMGGANAGPYVERVQKRTGNKKGDAWCASEIADAGYCALEKAWPLPLTGSCYNLGEFAKKENVLVDTPKRGDVFLIWFPKLNRFAHTGFVLDVIDATHVLTYSGNTTPLKPPVGANPREGWLNVIKPWAIGPLDRFIRWSSL